MNILWEPQPAWFNHKASGTGFVNFEACKALTSSSTINNYTKRTSYFISAAFFLDPTPPLYPYSSASTLPLDY